MENPILINTANVAEFGFQATFDLHTAKLKISWAPHTIFKAAGSTLVQSIAFRVTDPTGAVALDLVIPQPLSYTDIEVDLNTRFLFGYYTIEGTLTEQNARAYKIKLTRELCEPAGWKDGAVKGNFEVKVNCLDPSVQISDLTVMAYQRQRPEEVTRQGVLYYPDQVVEALPFSFSPFLLGQTEGIYTGTYTIRNLALATFDLEEGVFAVVPYKTSQEFIVDCNSSLEDVLCCLSDLQNTSVDFNSVAGKAARVRIDQAAPYVMVALMKEMTGKNAGKEVQKIRAILNCDCGCGGSQSVAPRLIGGGGSLIHTADGEGATTVATTTVGGTKNFKIRTKVVSVSKYVPSDGAFSISKIESALAINYAIAFDYGKLATNLLSAIGADEDLKTLFNDLVSQAGGLDLTGMDGKCIIDLEDPANAAATTEQVLQAIIDYLCGITTLKVKMGQELAGLSVDNKGKIGDKTFTLDALLSDYLNDVNAVLKALNTQVSKTILNCANIQAAFPATAKPIDPATDLIYGTKSGECARLSYKDLVKVILGLVKTDTDMKALFCEVAASCSVATCSAPQNISAYLQYNTYTATRQANFTKNNC